jgi:hypothetical protein
MFYEIYEKYFGNKSLNTFEGKDLDDLDLCLEEILLVLASFDIYSLNTAGVGYTKHILNLNKIATMISKHINRAYTMYHILPEEIVDMLEAFDIFYIVI